MLFLQPAQITTDYIKEYQLNNSMLFNFLTLSLKVMSLTILQIDQPQQLMFFMEVIPCIILFTGSIACHSHVLGCFVNIHNHYFLSFFFLWYLIHLSIILQLGQKFFCMFALQQQVDRSEDTLKMLTSVSQEVHSLYFSLVPALKELICSTVYEQCVSEHVLSYSRYLLG